MRTQSSSIRLRNFATAATLALGLSACGTPYSPETKPVASSPLLAGEILQVVHTINNGEIKQAGLALQRSENPYVLYYAQLMVQDHMALNQRVAALAVNSGANMEESVLSRTFHTQSNDVLSRTAKMTGQDFNCAYLDQQVKQHAMSLKTVREQLLPSADSSQVKELLASAAPRLEQHMKLAQDYRIGLQCP
jgi:putative membrane protein